MLYQIYETQRSLMEPFADLAEVAAKFYTNPAMPLSQLPMAQRVSAGYDLMHRLGKDYEKPDFRHSHGGCGRCRCRHPRAHRDGFAVLRIAPLQALL